MTFCKKTLVLGILFLGHPVVSFDSITSSMRKEVNGGGKNRKKGGKRMLKIVATNVIAS